MSGNSRLIRSTSICQNHFEENGATHIEHLAELSIRVKPDRLRKTGIICTIGPACNTVEKLKKMIANGMNIARLNFSHGDREEHAMSIAAIREAAKQSGDAVVAIALDTKGPEIRTGRLNNDEEVDLANGSVICLTTDPSKEKTGTATCVYVDYEKLPQAVQKGSTIFIDDGLIQLIVQGCFHNEVICIVENGGWLGSHKGVNLPGTPVDLPAVTDKDKEDLLFGVEQEVDIIFASFIRDATGLREIRKVLGEKGKYIKIIAKIENHEGVGYSDDIIAHSDGIMIARGDLGIEIPPEKVFLAQKMLSAKCNLAGKPVICATQMLESMISKPRPTRAECNDIANAVLDGVDCVMLSGETAKGAYPVESLQMMHKTCKEAEGAFYHSKFFEEILLNTSHPTDATNTIAISAVTALTCCHASAIILLTSTGKTAEMVSRYKPPVPIISVCRHLVVARQLHLCRSIFPIVYEGPKQDNWHIDVENRVRFGMEHGKNLKCLHKGDPIIVITGWKEGTGQTNTMRIMEVV